MAKQIKWEIPFQDINGVDYKIRIYDEYAGSSIQLIAGEQPFITEEDSSEDFFAPVRPSTAKIQVATMQPNRTMVSIEDFIPASNIERPVIVVRLDHTTTPDTEVIEWQGFLDAQSLSQEYTDVPQNLELCATSILGAMDSVFFDKNYIGMKRISDIIYECIRKISADSGIFGSGAQLTPCYYFTYFSAESWQIMMKYLDVCTFLSENEYTNEFVNTYIVSSVSLKEVLSRICTYMGWVAREQGRDIFFTRQGGEAYGMYGTNTSNLTSGQIGKSYFNTLAAPYQPKINTLIYHGANQVRSIYQGAKSVEVVANLDRKSVDMELPDCPIDNVIDNTVQFTTGGSNIRTIANLEKNFNSKLTFKDYTAHFTMDAVQNDNYQMIIKSTDTTLVEEVENCQASIMPIAPNGVAAGSWLRKIIGAKFDPLNDLQFCNDLDSDFPLSAFVAKINVKNAAGTEDIVAMRDGLFIAGFPTLHLYDSGNALHDIYPVGRFIGHDAYYQPTISNYIFKMKSSLPFSTTSLGNGFIRIYFDALNFNWQGYCNSYGSSTPMMNITPCVLFALKIGDKYIKVIKNQTPFTQDPPTYTFEWTSEFNSFYLENDCSKIISNFPSIQPDLDDEDGFYIPINEQLYGYVELYVYPHMMGYASRLEIMNTQGYVRWMHLSNLKVEYVITNADKNNPYKNNNGANKYYTLLDTNFAEEVSVDTHIVSYLNNKPAQNIVQNKDVYDNYTPMVKLVYNLTQSTTENRKPEVDLLGRLAKYYAKIRRKLELMVVHPTDAPLPMLTIDADCQDYDGKKYSPIAETRDYLEGTSTLTLMELPADSE